MKKLLLAMLFSLLFCSCGSAEEAPIEPITTITEDKQEKDIPTPTIEPTEALKPTETPKPTATPTVEPTATPVPTVYVEEKVQIVLVALIFGEETIEEYVDNLNSEESDYEYSVYDENHYFYEISRSEWKEHKEDVTISGFSEELLAELNESYPGVYQKVETDEKFQNVDIYVDKSVVDSAFDFGVYFTPSIVGMVYSDIYQAYNLVEVNERSYSVRLIDIETNEVIYTTE